MILNDNKMSICPRVGGMADYLDRLRMNRMYSGLKEEVVKVLGKVPLLGDPVERFLAQLKEAAKAGLHGGMLFEDLGLRYFGPIDGHNIGLLRKYLRMVQQRRGPDPAARRHRKGPRLPAGGRRPGAVPRAAAVRAAAPTRSCR